MPGPTIIPVSARSIGRLRPKTCASSVAPWLIRYPVTTSKSKYPPTVVPSESKNGGVSFLVIIDNEGSLLIEAAGSKGAVLGVWAGPEAGAEVLISGSDVGAELGCEEVEESGSCAVAMVENNAAKTIKYLSLELTKRPFVTQNVLDGKFENHTVRCY
jgi:hypothetical protein